MASIKDGLTSALNLRLLKAVEGSPLVKVTSTHLDLKKSPCKVSFSASSVFQRLNVNGNLEVEA